VQQIKGIEKDTDYNIESKQKQYKHLNIKERVCRFIKHNEKNIST